MLFHIKLKNSILSLGTYKLKLTTYIRQLVYNLFYNNTTQFLIKLIIMSLWAEEYIKH